MAQVSFHVQNSIAITPARAPFGSFLFSNSLSPVILHDFVTHCEAHLQKSGITSLILTEPPLFYRKSGELLHAILLNRQFRVSKAELSSGIKIDKTVFEEKIEAWEKRKLKQAKAKGLQFRALPITEVGNVYDFILACRKQRGQTLSMTLEELRDTIKIFKKSFYLFGTYFQKELAAASIAIQVHPTILYNFYSGHLKKFDSISPVVLLTSGMYKFCESNQFSLLDLGTSSVDGRLNFNLLDFKFRLGAVPSMKLTFEKELV